MGTAGVRSVVADLILCIKMLFYS